jgi:hypothetical protein
LTDDAYVVMEAFGPWNAKEVNRIVVEKKISPKAPAGSGAKKSNAKSATRVNKVAKVAKVAKVTKVAKVAKRAR